MLNIAIDGPSASGKSTIAKELCRRLNYKHLDTGAMYRCVALKAHSENVDYEDDDKLEEMLNRISIDFTPEGRVILDGRDVSEAIRTNEISMLASTISAKPIVREYLVRLQQAIASVKGYILDGRDIGTVVLPDAELKIFMTASVDARAKRRYLENQNRGIKSNLRTLKKEIIERDYQDTHRKHSPLKKADDAIELDTSNMSITEVVDWILNKVKEKL